MTVNTRAAAPAVAQRWGTLRSSVNLLDHEGTLGYVLMTPALLLLAIFIAYPFVIGVWYSLSDARLVGLGDFLGLDNYQHPLHQPVFQPTIRNSLVSTGFA